MRYQKLFEQDAAKQVERERQRETARPLMVFTTAPDTSVLSPLGPQLELVPVPVGPTQPTPPFESPVSSLGTEPAPVTAQRVYARQPVPPLSRANYKSTVRIVN